MWCYLKNWKKILYKDINKIEYDLIKKRNNIILVKNKYKLTEILISEKTTFSIYYIHTHIDIFNNNKL